MNEPGTGPSQLGTMAPQRARGRSWGDAFNVVMATGIVSIAAHKFGLHVLSLVLLGLAVLAFIPLFVIDALRVRQPLLLLQRASAPRSGLPALGFVAATAVVGSRLVLVTGILTYTFSPQVAILQAWRSISPKSSANTSNEIGRSRITCRMSWAKAS